MGGHSRETRPGHPAWRPGRGGAPLERDPSPLAIPTMRRVRRAVAPGWEATTRELTISSRIACRRMPARRLVHNTQVKIS
jgi:hypothetical protein